MTWEIEQVILYAQKDDPDPGTGSRNCLFVPEIVKKQVLSWVHNLKLTCHLGYNRMFALFYPETLLVAIYVL